eukprot:Skav221627  [mRNA]  locus=scaffold4037:51236:58385:+ [translate_table: standard]
MSCPRCRVFFGDPCRACRTVERIGQLLRSLATYQENLALTALRECAGNLADLGEIAASDPVLRAIQGQPAGSVPGPRVPEVRGGDIPEPSERKEADKEKDKKRETAFKGKEEETGREKKKKSKTKEKESKKSKEKKRKAEDRTEDEESQEEERPGPTGDRTLTVGRVDERDPEEERREIQRRVDRHVEENPKEHGLEKVSVRGSAGRHFDSGVEVSASVLNPLTLLGEEIVETTKKVKREIRGQERGSPREDLGGEAIVTIRGERITGEQSKPDESSNGTQGKSSSKGSCEGQSKSKGRDASTRRSFEETATRGSRRGHSRTRRSGREMEPWGDSSCGGPQVGRPVTSSPTDRRGRHVLHGRGKGGREADWERGQWRSHVYSAGSDRHHLREPAQVAVGGSRDTPEAALVPSGMWRERDGRRPDAHAEGEKDRDSYRRVALQHGQGRADDGRRACSAEEARCGARALDLSGPRRSCSRRRRKRSESRRQKRRRREIEEKGGEREEEEKRQEKDQFKRRDRREGSSEWTKGQIGRNENPDCPLWGYGAGSQRKDQEQSCQRSKEKCKKEGQEERIQQLQQSGEHPRVGGRSEWRHLLPASIACQVNSRHTPRSPQLSNAGTDEELSPSRGRSRGLEERRGSGGPPILPDHLDEKRGWSNDEGVVHALGMRGFPITGKTMSCFGHSYTTHEGIGVSVERRSLERQSTDRNPSPGFAVFGTSTRSPRSSTGRLCGAEDEDVGTAPGRKSQRRREGKRKWKIWKERWKKGPQGRRWQRRSQEEGRSTRKRVMEAGEAHLGRRCGAEIPERMPEVSQGRESEEKPDTTNQNNKIPPEDDRTEGGKYESEGGAAHFSQMPKKSSMWSVQGSTSSTCTPGEAPQGPTWSGSLAATEASDADPAQLEAARLLDVPGGEKIAALHGLCGRLLMGCGVNVYQFLLEVVSLRSQSTGRPNSKAVYPLPTSRSHLCGAFPDLTGVVVDWLMCVVLCLNSYWGSEPFCDKPPNVIQLKCLRGLVHDVQRFCELTVSVPMDDWASFLKVKSIDYKGDEVQVARWFQWENVGPALPDEVGSVPLVDVCSLGCRHYVTHFEEYLKPKEEWGRISAPRVMVEDHDWGRVCEGLVSSGVCVFIKEEDVFDTGSGPLLNGLFGVTKEEWTSTGTEIFRLIMNLIPLNGLCQPISGDIDSLPAWSGMNPYFLQPHENLLVSSEDVKCFFYTMSLPDEWIKFLAFNKEVPSTIAPAAMAGHRVYIAARVLPMGFLNSVSLAQHVHRNLVAWSRGSPHDNAPEAELRKDMPFSYNSVNWRVYLDNFDLLEKVQATDMVETQQHCPAGVLSLREGYELWKVPRNLKKSVTRSHHCEVQGATVDGVMGVAFPREAKLAKYFGLAVQLLAAGRGTQKQWQVVCGGLVYVAMFRRALLGSLNAVWKHIMSFDHQQSQYKVTPMECQLEVIRFLGLLPLARLDFRLDVASQVTCSDASSSGGGICVSSGLSGVGELVASGHLRGEVPEPQGEKAVLSIGLFDGISALRVALDVLGVKVIGHVSVECQEAARRVVESHYPGSILVNNVEDIDDQMVQSWGRRFGRCNLVLLGAGPPCQGVSGLNSDRRGALRDERSSLFVHVPRIRGLLQKYMPWAPVHSLMESVASMDEVDRNTMSEGFGTLPLYVDAGELTWCSRPRLYWLSWEVFPHEGVSFGVSPVGVTSVHFEGSQDLADVVRQGWEKVDVSRPFPTFTTSRPRTKAGRKPAGIHQCSLSEIEAWTRDEFRFPPYQYKLCNGLQNAAGETRLPDVSEREVMLGFPLHYTAPCCSKQDRKRGLSMDLRLTLLGNSWSVPVVSCLLVPLFSLLGFMEYVTPREILHRCKPGNCDLVQGRLVRLPLNPLRRSGNVSSYDLAFKLCNLVSIKGEDVLLSSPSQRMTQFHRLRASIPSKLWKWRVVAGWQWTLGAEHINALELRAILTSIRWRLEHQHEVGTRMVHLTDSMVCGAGRLSPNSGMPKRKLLEANQPEERAAQRRRLGTLRELTVQPATKRRYALATTAFFKFLQSESLVLPRELSKLDDLVCDYVEHLWASGAGRAQANDTIAGLQDLQPNVRGKLPGSWRLLKTWSVNELPNRAPPIPEHVMLAMAGWSFFHGHTEFAISLLIGFYCMLRTGEVLVLRSSNMLCTPRDKQVLISLGMTKGGKRHGAAESVVLGYEPAVDLVKAWKSVRPASTPLAMSPAQWRGLFAKCLKELRLDSFQFRPYSLRRGGATFWFSKHQNLDKILVQGRWHTLKSARIYLNEGLAVLASMKLPVSDPRIKPFTSVFFSTLKSKKFQTLEPTAKGSRSGGRGKSMKARKWRTGS